MQTHLDKRVNAFLVWLLRLPLRANGVRNAIETRVHYTLHLGGTVGRLYTLIHKTYCCKRLLSKSTID